MLTFSCALQTVDCDGVPLTFGLDPEDTSICILKVGDTLVRFNRNGQHLDTCYPEPADAAPVEEAPSSSKKKKKEETW